jgi:transposase
MDYTTNALGLQELIVTNYQETEKNISVFAETKPSPQICPWCRQTTAYIHGYRQQKIKDLVSHAKPVDIFLRKRLHFLAR